MKNYIFNFSVLFLLLIFCSLPVSAASGKQQIPASQFLEKNLLDANHNFTPSQWTRLERAAYIRGQLSKLRTVNIKYDSSTLSARDKEMIKNLIKAAEVMDRIFLRQTYSANTSNLARLRSSKDPLDALVLKYYIFNKAPFDRLNEMKAFYGYESRPAGANFYPADMTKAEYDDWIAANPQDAKMFVSDFTVIKRQNANLAAVPYHIEYADLLTQASFYLKKAAESCDYPTLKTYLLSRAEAFQTDNYYQSDVDWMMIENSPVELVIGPYEVYEDHLLNAKASYEAFIYQTIPNDAKLFSSYVKYLPELENNLPIPDTDKNMDRDFSSPIRIVNLIFSSGDAKAGVHTSAFALPNDERVRKEKGSKKVMLKNVMSAKFEASTYPIGLKVIDPAQIKYISFDSYFRDVVFHELAHGLGPGEINMPDGTKKDVRNALGDLYSSIEECKADTLAMYNQFYLMDKGIISANDFKNMCVSYLTGIFRSVRFGVGEAHGKGALVQLNWMIKHDAFGYDKKSGRYSVNFEKFRTANSSLAKELLDIQRTGDYARGKAFLDEYAETPSHLTRTIATLYDIPIDIMPVFADQP